jgi:hypothetical protein
VAGRVGECLLGDPVERLFAARRQPQPCQVDLRRHSDTTLVGEALAEHGERCLEGLALQRPGA